MYPFSISVVFLFSILLHLSFISSSSSQCADYSNRCINGTTVNNSSMIACCSPTAICDAFTYYYCIEPSLSECKASGDRCSSNITDPSSGRPLLHPCCDSRYSCRETFSGSSDHRCQTQTNTDPQCIQEGSVCYSSSPSPCCDGLRCYGGLFSDEKQCRREDPKEGFERFATIMIVVIIVLIISSICGVIALIYFIVRWCRNRSSITPPQSSDIQNLAPSQLV